MKLAQKGRLRKGFRTEKGSSIAEFGPALFLLFFFALFPAIDLIGIGMSYLSCVALNDLQVREAVRVPKSQAIDPKGTVQLAIPEKWRPTVLGGLGGTIEPPTTEVSYIKGKRVMYVNVATTCTMNPILTIPFFVRVPGLGAPFVTTINHSRVIENPMFYMQ